MALMAIMTLCLMVYAALEHRIRQSLAQRDPRTFPTKGRATARPTARWVFQSFMDIHLLTLPSLAEIVPNLKTHHRALLALLGDHYVALYANSDEGVRNDGSDDSTRPATVRWTAQSSMCFFQRADKAIDYPPQKARE